MNNKELRAQVRSGAPQIQIAAALWVAAGMIVMIAAVGGWVLPFAFLGLATFLLGFGFAFANILRNVRLRGATMAAVLPVAKQRRESA